MGLERTPSGITVYPTEIQRIAVADNIHHHVHDRFSGRIVDTIGRGLSPEELIRRLNQYDVQAVITRTGINFDTEGGRIMQEAAHLSTIFAACRNPRVDRAAARENGIWTHRVDANVNHVADRTMLKILEFAHGTMNLNASPDWAKSEIDGDDFELPGKKLGIIGFGAIGKKVAEQAMAQGMDVIVYNDGPENGRSRAHDRAIEEKIQELQTRYRSTRNQISRAERLTDVFRTADIVTVHTNSENWKGETNKGLITRRHLEMLKGEVQAEYDDDYEWINHDTGQKMRRRLGIVLNPARAGVMGVTPEEILDLLSAKDVPKAQPGQRPEDWPDLRYFFTDVIKKDLERKGAYSPQFDPNHPAIHRVNVSHHTYGSGSRIGRNSVEQIARRSMAEWEGGFFDLGRSTSFERNFLGRPSYGNGDVVLALTTSTHKRTNERLTEIFGELGLNVGDQNHIADFRDGTSGHGEVGRFTHVPRVFVLQNGDHSLEDIAQSIMAELDKLNGTEDHDGNPIKIVNARFIPTNSEQRAELNSPDFRAYPNRTEV